MKIPAFVICRDLVTWTRRTVAALEKTPDVGEIFLLDNASTYYPLRSWLDSTNHTVIDMGGNFGKHGPWRKGFIEYFAGWSPFIVTDPDVVPAKDCPSDWVEHFLTALDTYPGLAKVGFSLRIDELPEHYEHAQAVQARQRQFWDERRLTADGQFYRADVDTTLAVYPSGGFRRLRTKPSLRSAAPYTALHLPWYLDSKKPSAELRYYRRRAAPQFGHWAKKELPHRLATRLDRRFSSGVDLSRQEPAT